MNKTQYRQFKAIEAKNKKRILEVCPKCPDTSGIYFLVREEDGFKYAYIGKAKHLLTRLAQHLKGYQHIDLSLKKHGLWSKENPVGYKITFIEHPENELDENEQQYIKIYANAGYQLRNIESGGTKGKKDIGERRPARGYRDGLNQGYLNARRDVSNWFEKHLEVSMKKPTKNAEKALAKFQKFINLEDENDGM